MPSADVDLRNERTREEDHQLTARSTASRRQTELRPPREEGERREERGERNMLQEKTPLQRKTRSESAGEGRKAGGRGAAAGRGEEGDSGVAVGLVGGEERTFISEGRSPSLVEKIKLLGPLELAA